MKKITAHNTKQVLWQLNCQLKHLSKQEAEVNHERKMDKSRRKEIKKQYKAQSRQTGKNLKWNNKPLTQGKQLTVELPQWNCPSGTAPVGLPQWDCPSGTDGWLIRELKLQGKQVDDMKLEQALP